MNTFLSKMNERERWMVLSAVFCVLAYIYYFLIYQPISTKIEQKKILLVEKADTLAWMTKIQNLKTATPEKKTVDSSQLLTLVATQLKKSTSVNFPYRLQQTSAGELQLSFDQVPFNLFLHWLAKLDENYVISIKQFTANKTATPGIAQIMIIMSSVVTS